MTPFSPGTAALLGLPAGVDMLEAVSLLQGAGAADAGAGDAGARDAEAGEGHLLEHSDDLLGTLDELAPPVAPELSVASIDLLEAARGSAEDASEHSNLDELDEDDPLFMGPLVDELHSTRGEQLGDTDVDTLLSSLEAAIHPEAAPGAAIEHL